MKENPFSESVDVQSPAEVQYPADVGVEDAVSTAIRNETKSTIVIGDWKPARASGKPNPEDEVLKKYKKLISDMGDDELERTIYSDFSEEWESILQKRFGTPDKQKAIRLSWMLMSIVSEWINQEIDAGSDADKTVSNVCHAISILNKKITI